jgi:hypothetical protein
MKAETSRIPFCLLDFIGLTPRPGALPPIQLLSQVQFGSLQGWIRSIILTEDGWGMRLFSNPAPAMRRVSPFPYTSRRTVRICSECGERSDPGLISLSIRLRHASMMEYWWGTLFSSVKAFIKDTISFNFIDAIWESREEFIVILLDWLFSCGVRAIVFGYPSALSSSRLKARGVGNIWSVQELLGDNVKSI